jgi:hypothetical protein
MDSYLRHRYLSSLLKRWKETKEKEREKGTERDQREREREGYPAFLPGSFPLARMQTL